MPELDDIVQNIALAGQDDVIQAFGQIGKAGASAFEQLAKSAGVVGEALAGIGAAFAGVGGAIGLWAKHSSEVAESLDILSKQSGESVESISELQGAISALGGDAEGLGRAFQRMGLTVAREWDQIKKQVSEASDKAINDALSIDKAQAALFHAQDARRKALYGDKAGADPETLKLQKQKESLTSVREAQQHLAEAEKKQDEDRLNSKDAYTAAVKEIITGQKDFADASKDANLSVDNVIKGLVTNTKGAEEAFENFHGGLNEFIGSGPDLKEVFYNLADYMKNSGNAAQNNALQMRLLGRGLNADLIGPLHQGSAAIKEQEAAMEKYHLVLTEDMIKPGLEFHDAYNRLSHDLVTTTQQIGLLFDPSITAGMQDLTKYIEENHDAIMAWASDLAGKITPYITGFFDSLKGLAAYLAGDKLDMGTNAGQWEEAWQRIGTVVKEVGAVIVGVLGVIKSAVEGLSGLTGLKTFETALYALLAFGGYKALGSAIGKDILAGIIDTLTLGFAGGLIGKLLGEKAPAAAARAAPAAAGAEVGATEAGLAGALGGLSLRAFLLEFTAAIATVMALIDDVTRRSPTTEKAGDLLQKALGRQEITAEEFGHGREQIGKITAETAQGFKQLVEALDKTPTGVHNFLKALDDLIASQPKTKEALAKEEEQKKAAAPLTPEQQMMKASGKSARELYDMGMRFAPGKDESEATRRSRLEKLTDDEGNKLIRFAPEKKKVDASKDIEAPSLDTKPADFPKPRSDLPYREPSTLGEDIEAPGLKPHERAYAETGPPTIGPEEFGFKRVGTEAERAADELSHLADVLKATQLKETHPTIGPEDFGYQRPPPPEVSGGMEFMKGIDRYITYLLGALAETLTGKRVRESSADLMGALQGDPQSKLTPGYEESLNKMFGLERAPNANLGQSIAGTLGEDLADPLTWVSSAKLWVKAFQAALEATTKETVRKGIDLPRSDDTDNADFVKALKDAPILLNDASDALRPLPGLLDDTGKAFKGTAVASNDVEQAFALAARPINDTKTAMQGLPAPTGATADAMQKLSQPTGSAADAMGNLPAPTKSAADAMDKVSGPAGSTATSLGGIPPPADRVTAALSKLATALENLPPPGGGPAAAATPAAPESTLPTIKNAPGTGEGAPEVGPGGYAPSGAKPVPRAGTPFIDDNGILRNPFFDPKVDPGARERIQEENRRRLQEFEDDKKAIQKWRDEMRKKYLDPNYQEPPEAPDYSTPDNPPPNGYHPESEEERQRLLHPKRPPASGGDQRGSIDDDDDNANAKDGGLIEEGFGSGTSDDVHINASKGEYIVKADGSNLDEANKHFGRGYQEGGLVDSEGNPYPDKPVRINPPTATGDTFPHREYPPAQRHYPGEVLPHEGGDGPVHGEGPTSGGGSVSMAQAEAAEAARRKQLAAEAQSGTQSGPVRVTQDGNTYTVSGGTLAERQRVANELKSKLDAQAAQQKKQDAKRRAEMKKHGPFSTHAMKQHLAAQFPRMHFKNIFQDYFGYAAGGLVGGPAPDLPVTSVTTAPPQIPPFGDVGVQDFSKLVSPLTNIPMGAVSPDLFAQLSAPAQPTPFEQGALADLGRRLGGMGGGFMSAATGMTHSFGGGIAPSVGPAAGSGVPTHTLDIRTDAGNFTATVAVDTLGAINRSSLGSKLSQTGARPTWFS